MSPDIFSKVAPTVMFIKVTVLSSIYVLEGNLKFCQEHLSLVNFFIGQWIRQQEVNVIHQEAKIVQVLLRQKIFGQKECCSTKVSVAGMMPLGVISSLPASLVGGWSCSCLSVFCQFPECCDPNSRISWTTPCQTRVSNAFWLFPKARRAYIQERLQQLDQNTADEREQIRFNALYILDHAIHCIFCV